MIFFDWGKLEIGRDYAAELDRIASVAARVPGTSVKLEGHSDRSGSAVSNRRSSSRRVDAVRDYLISRGVPVGQIQRKAWGEDRPLVVTQDGVREAQNRRVDVILTK